MLHIWNKQLEQRAGESGGEGSGGDQCAGEGIKGVGGRSQGEDGERRGRFGRDGEEIGGEEGRHEAKLKEAVMEAGVAVREVERDMSDERKDAERRER